MIIFNTVKSSNRTHATSLGFEISVCQKVNLLAARVETFRQSKLIDTPSIEVGRD
jgi:hypothetical protein